MNAIFLDLGIFKIYWYSVILLIAFIIGGILVLKESKKYNIDKERISDLAFYLIIFSLLGARLYYIIFNWNYYSVNLIDIFKVWEGGLAIHGGLIAGLLVLIHFSKKNKINLFKMTDIMVVGLIVGQAIGRWGNFFNSEAHGSITTLKFLQDMHIPEFIINGMNINGVYYEPTFLYESIWCIIGFIILLLIRRFLNSKTGTLTSFYLIWYGIGRFIIEGMRTDSLMLGNLRMAQLISLFMIVSGLIISIVLNFKKNTKRYKEEYYE